MARALKLHDVISIANLFSGMTVKFFPIFFLDRAEGLGPCLLPCSLAPGPARDALVRMLPRPAGMCARCR